MVDGDQSSSGTRGAILQIRLESTEKKAFGDAAKLAGIPLSSWVRERLRRVAVRELEEAAIPIAFLESTTED